MKYFILISTLIFSGALFGATCTETTRTNYSAGQVLTSSALNADFNQLVTKANSFDGGCVADGTLEFSALNLTDFASVSNGIQAGCAVSYVGVNTVSVDKCLATVSGKNIKTTVATNVTWGCSGCSAEVSSTQYYVYIKTGSSGSTLNPLISTLAPDNDGYDGLGNKIVGKFYNGATGDILDSSIYSWAVNRFFSPLIAEISPTITVGATFAASATGPVFPCTTNGACGIIGKAGLITSISRTATGSYTIVFSKTFAYIACTGTLQGGAGNTTTLSPLSSYGLNTDTLTVTTNSTTTPFAAEDSNGSIVCVGN